MKRQDYYDYTDVSPYREVSLSGLFLRVLRSWRLILLAGLLGGLLLGGLQVYRYHSRRDAINEKRAAYEQDLTVYENARRSYQEEIDELEDTINRRQNYVRDSVLMQIDPQNAAIASAVFSVRVPELDNETDTDDAAGISRMNDLVRTFCRSIRDGDAAAQAAAQTGIGETDLKELVSASYEETPRQVSTSGTNQTTILMSDQVTGLFTLTVRAPDEETAGRILDHYMAGIETQAETLRETAGDFTLLTMSRSVTTAVDNDLMTYQNLKFAEIYTLQNNLNNKQKFLTALAKPSYADAYSGRTLLKTGIKYGIAGFVAAACCVMLVLALLFLASGRILSGAEIDRKFGFKNLVTFGDDGRKKGLPLDRLIRRLEYGGPIPEYAESCDLLLSRLLNIAGSTGRRPAGRTILLTGGVSDRRLRGLQKSLEERAGKQESDIRFAVLSDPARHPASLHLVRDCSGVVLVEEPGRSSYRDILRTVDLVDDTGRPVLGTVYF